MGDSRASLAVPRLVQYIQQILSLLIFAPVMPLRNEPSRPIRKRCRSGAYCDEVSKRDLEGLAHLPCPEAAKRVGLGLTVRAAAACLGFQRFKKSLPMRTPTLRYTRPLLPCFQAFKHRCRALGIKKWPYRKGSPKVRPTKGSHCTGLLEPPNLCT